MTLIIHVNMCESILLMCFKILIQSELLTRAVVYQDNHYG